MKLIIHTEHVLFTFISALRICWIFLEYKVLIITSLSYGVYISVIELVVDYFAVFIHSTLFLVASGD